MEPGTDRREARRFTMTLPLRVRTPGDKGEEFAARTRDVSFRGLYFLVDADLKLGSEIEFVLVLPGQVTLSSDVHIRCYGQVVRVEEQNGQHGVAARIERYEFLPAAA